MKSDFAHTLTHSLTHGLENFRKLHAVLEKLQLELPFLVRRPRFLVFVLKQLPAAQSLLV